MSPQPGLHMGRNNLCYVTRHFLFFTLCHHVTFYKSLTSLSTVYIESPRRISTTFKVAVSHLRFLPMWSPTTLSVCNNMSSAAQGVLGTYDTGPRWGKDLSSARGRNPLWDSSHSDLHKQTSTPRPKTETCYAHTSQGEWRWHNCLTIVRNYS